VKLDVDEAITILPVWDLPLQQYVGSESTNSIKVEWLEEDLTAQTVTITSVVGTVSPWTVTLTPDNTGTEAQVIRPGDVVHLVGAAYDRQFYVSSVNTGSNAVTVTSFAGTTDSNDPAAADVWEIIGQYRNEGSDPEDARSVERTLPYNYTQWGQEKVEVTRTQAKRAMYGVSDPYGHELMKKFKELGIRFEKSMVNGYRTLSSDSKKRFMGGLFYYISTNSRSGVVANTKSLINSLIRDAYTAGGNPDTLMVSPAVKAAISTNIDPTLRRTDRTDRVGGYVVDTIETDFNTINVVANRHFPLTKGILLQREFIKRRPFDPYFHELLAKTGDADKGHIVGEQSLEVKNEKAHGILTLTDAT
jgi:hypothetical protein